MFFRKIPFLIFCLVLFFTIKYPPADEQLDIFLPDIGWEMVLSRKCGFADLIIPDIGKVRVQRDASVYEGTIIYGNEMISSSDFKMVFSLMLNGIHYHICPDSGESDKGVYIGTDDPLFLTTEEIEKNTRYYWWCKRKAKVKYISTSDSGFRTPEGIKVGTPLVDLMRDGKFKLHHEPGWACYVPLPSGWAASFNYFDDKGNIIPCEDLESRDASVTWFFKR